MAGIADFLTPESMRKLEAMAIRSRYVVEGFRAGMHASPLKGASVEDGGVFTGPECTRIMSGAPAVQRVVVRVGAGHDLLQSIRQIGFAGQTRPGRMRTPGGTGTTSTCSLNRTHPDCPPPCSGPRCRC